MRILHPGVAYQLPSHKSSVVGLASTIRDHFNEGKHIATLRQSRLLPDIFSPVTRVDGIHDGTIGFRARFDHHSNADIGSIFSGGIPTSPGPGRQCRHP